MVDEQIAARGIRDENVLNVMRRVPRHVFVPRDLRAEAYEDYPLTIGQGQTISQPFIVAYMTEALQLKGHEKILEVGTGCGYQTAVLAALVQKVYTVEVLKELSQKAQQLLASLGFKNIFFKAGDGHEGWIEAAPFDAIIVTAAAPKFPQTLFDQLKEGGRMILPIGSIDQRLYLISKTKTGYEQKELFVVRFVSMVKGA